MYKEEFERHIEYKLKDVPKEKQLRELKRFLNCCKYPGIYYRIGLLYEQGIEKSENPTEWLTWYEKAIEKDYEPAVQHLIELYMNSSSIHMIKACHLLTKEKELNPKEGYYLTGKYYLLQAIHNPKVTGYFEIGLSNLSKASELGHEDASATLQYIKQYE